MCFLVERSKANVNEMLVKKDALTKRRNNNKSMISKTGRRIDSPSFLEHKFADTSVLHFQEG